MAYHGPEGGLLPFAFVALVVAVLSASQDIVIDAYRTDAARVAERGPAATAANLGYRASAYFAYAGALVLGSATPPVTEMIEHEKNGLLYDFFDVKGLASSAIEVLGHPERFASIREAARRTVVERYDLATRCLPEWLSLIDASAGAKTAERT